jgi:fumarylacetoacetate (FAA) hydrolase
MKLVSYLNGGQEQVGLLLHDEVFKLQALHPLIPATMEGLLGNWDYYIGMALRAELTLKLDPIRQRAGIPLRALQLLSPVPRPGSLRDGYAFRQHVLTARRNRGLEMTPVFDEFPVFYFGNHRTVCGPGIIECMPDVLDELDYELEVAVVINRAGKNIRACEAEQYMAGLMIMNDFSARRLQMDEMQLSLGPAKGKDFATACGPWLVTMEELEPYACAAPQGHTGRNWDLAMLARVDDGLLSVGKLSDMHWTFAELIERASYGVELYPGDIIGSGTVGTGCLLELNGTNRLKDPEYVAQWLEAGEVIELEVEGLGILRNEITRTENDFSILGKKIKPSKSLTP